MSNEIKFFIAGVQFHPGAAAAIRKLSEGDEVYLVPEPTNKYDLNAVRIENEEGVLLGYVPKVFSSKVAALLEVDPCECLVETVTPNAKTYEMCRVVIRQSDEIYDEDGTNADNAYLLNDTDEENE